MCSLAALYWTIQVRGLLMNIVGFQQRLAALYEQITQEREVFTNYAQEPFQRRASEVLP
jgi:hypothetical protein